MIIVVTYHKQKTRAVLTNLYMALCWSILFVLVLDTCVWADAGILFKNPIPVTYTLNFMLHLCQPIPLIIWLYYIDFMFNKSTERLKHRWSYLLPFILTVILMIYSTFTGFIFYIDDSNIYHVGPGLILITILYALPLLASFANVIKYRKTSDRKTLCIIVLFSIIPVAGMILQVPYGKGPLVWPSVGLLVILIYIFLQAQRDTRDYLTGLLNRQQIDELIKYRIKDHSRRGGFGIIMIDMDDFKLINDEYGHTEGDEALITLSSILISSIKTKDKAGRFGGDEFIIMVDTDNDKAMEEVIDRIHKKITLINSKKKKPYEISISAGYVIYSPEKYSSFIELMSDADKNMYEVKKAGKFDSEKQGIQRPLLCSDENP
ncbi:MAG: GGDEF domain-containing protein [Spirochaetales bacterium]|nr:GGDEF domain-containing protein [Spirochaetales bacterium]